MTTQPAEVATRAASADVYVPNLSASPGLARDAAGIDPGSGIVGRRVAVGLQIDYEGNRFGAVNMITFADRVAHAADRHALDYPTTARRFVRREAFWRVARFTPGYGIMIGEESAADIDGLAGATAIDAGLRVFRIARWIGLVEEASDLGDEVSEQLARELRVTS